MFLKNTYGENFFNSADTDITSNIYTPPLCSITYYGLTHGTRTRAATCVPRCRRAATRIAAARVVGGGGLALLTPFNIAVSSTRFPTYGGFGFWFSA